MNGKLNNSAQTTGGHHDASLNPDASQHPNSCSQQRKVSIVQQLAAEAERVARLEARDTAEQSLPQSRLQHEV